MSSRRNKLHTRHPCLIRNPRLAGGLAAALTLLACAGPAWAFGASGGRVWFPEDVSAIGARIDRLFLIILGITGAIFLLVEGALLYFLIRYRRRAHPQAAYFHGNHLAEVIWTVIPAVIVLYLAFGSQRVWSQVRGTPPAHQVEIEVTAEQFAWNFRYAGADKTLRTADDIETINQLHLPVGQVVLVRLTSKDVIHSFFLPQFRIKMDAVPGLNGRVWLQATKAGHFEIACAELCGLGHYRMRGFVTIESPEAFAAWLKQAQVEQSS